jgi:uncharacterized protein YjiS (DUF1127 family)
MSKNLNENLTTDDSNVVQGSFRPTLVSRIVAAFKSWNSRRKAVRELNAMPDVLLRDIGIERYQITEAVNNSGAFAEIIRMRGENVVHAPRVRKAA